MLGAAKRCSALKGIRCSGALTAHLCVLKQEGMEPGSQAREGELTHVQVKELAVTAILRPHRTSRPAVHSKESRQELIATATAI